MTTPSKFKTHKEAEANGWYSRRHPSNKERLEAKAKRKRKWKKI